MSDPIKYVSQENLNQFASDMNTKQKTFLASKSVVDGLVEDVGALSDTIDQAVSDITVLDGRVDNITSLPAGSVSTSADAELVDIRVGADGTTYATAGDAVRGQVGDLLTPMWLYKSPNLFNKDDPNMVVTGKALNNSGNITSNPDYDVLKIPIEDTNASYGLYGANSLGTSYIRKSTRIAMYDENGNNLGLLVNNTTSPAIVTNPNCKYLYCHIQPSAVTLTEAMFMNTEIGNILDTFYPYDKKLKVKTQWTGLNWGAFGDSITVIVNGNYGSRGWARPVYNQHGFNQFYGRGVGAQKFAWGTGGGAVTFVNADGTYNSRNDSYNKDNYTGDVPEGCTVCRGSMCSWDRITSMFPESIKDSINMIFIMGGTNDAFLDTLPSWFTDSDTDPEWYESSYYADYGGDYNISTIAGGLASCIMKMQAWMPQARIIVGTPLNGQTGQTGSIKPALVPDEYDKSVIMKRVCDMFGIPVIDVYGKCGINVLNSPTYITDGTHPYNKAGANALGLVVSAGLLGINPIS